jgi:hypothetical protein
MLNLFNCNTQRVILKRIFCPVGYPESSVAFSGSVVQGSVVQCSGVQCSVFREQMFRVHNPRDCVNPAIVNTVIDPGKEQQRFAG